ncbi:MAG: chemotaxis protein CheW [Desulfamplus sp.]|nr:chemotaxis protein CheW [Desulfamplus sp.]MBF0390147.1 chemotaxis protein CheW [Desulfamplus sp.]
MNSDDILVAIRGSIKSNEVVDVEEEAIKFVIFRVAGNLYAAYGSDVREILPNKEIYPVPFLPEYLPGLINVRGDIESVIDISSFLGGKKIEQSKVMVMMVKKENFCSGIIVDDIEDVVDMPITAIEPPLSTLSGVAKELIAGRIEFLGNTVSLIDIGKLAAKVAI